MQEVNVNDSSFHMTLIKGKIGRESEAGGFMQNRNPWKVLVKDQTGLPTDNTIQKSFNFPYTKNDTILYKKNIIAFTQWRFCLITK